MKTTWNAMNAEALNAAPNSRVTGLVIIKKTGKIKLFKSLFEYEWHTRRTKIRF